jgi:hypothetical protein
MISDDDLLLYYYRDGLDAGERARIGAALSEQPELAHRLQRLVAQLDAAAAIPDVPVPARIRQRWQEALDRAARKSNERAQTPAATARPGFFTALRWQVAAGAAVVTVVIVITILVSIQTPRERTAQDVSPASTQAAASTPDASAYERGLKWHLANTEQRLASLDSAQGEERARLIETIVAQNRMYALAAERADEPELARVLRAFTPILESLAEDRGDTAASDIAQLHFEMRVMQARLNAAAASRSTASSVTL